MPKKTLSPESLALQQSAQDLLNECMRRTINYRKFDIPEQTILKQAQVWDDLLSQGAPPNLTLDRSLQSRNVFHLGRLAVQFEPLFQIYIKHQGPLNYKEKDTSTEYTTLPKIIVGLWREAKRDRLKFMNENGKRVVDPDTWAFEKIMFLKEQGITTTLDSSNKSILDDILTHQFLLKTSSNDTGFDLMSRLLEEDIWFASKKEEKEAISASVKHHLPDIYALLVSRKEKGLLTKDLSETLKSKTPRPTKLL